MEKNNTKNSAPKITRREAIKKTGYAAFASTTMLLLLNNPAKVFASSDQGGTIRPRGSDSFDYSYGNDDSSDSSRSYGDYENF